MDVHLNFGFQLKAETTAKQAKDGDPSAHDFSQINSIAEPSLKPERQDLIGFPGLLKEKNFEILQFLPVEDMPSAACVCKLWSDFLKDKLLLCKKNNEYLPKTNARCF